MSSINEISYKQIIHLEQNDLTELLLKLLNLESIKSNLQGPTISVPLNITISDGGEDGSISWQSGPDKTNYLPKRWSFFQNKATKLTPEQCSNELFEKKKKGNPLVLKPRVQELVDANGCYILFTTHALNPQHITERIKKMREGLAKVAPEKAASFHFEIYDANKIAEWVNHYSAAVILVQIMNGMDRLNGFQNWEEWALNKSLNETVYHSNERLEKYKEQIVDAAASSQSLRLSGHSGLGKTRLMFEAFRGSNLRNLIIYYDLAGDAGVKPIKDFYLNNQNSQHGILIIDNCNTENHNILSSLKTVSSKLLLITIGFEDDNSIQEGRIKLERKEQFEIVKQIIDDKLPGYPDTDKVYLNSLCEGYPAMATIFCANIKRVGLSSFDAMVPDEFVKKLLFGSEQGDIDYKVIRACSVFSSFGFPDDDFRSVLSIEEKKELENQIEYICANVLDNEISVDRFYAICQSFRQKGIIERIGLYYVVKPPALAIKLATGWLLSTRSEKIQKILTDLKGNELGNKITERLINLDQVNKAPEIAKELWGPGRFFSTAEVLNTTWGSQLFRNICEVNPQAAASAIFQTFSSWTTAQLRTVVDGRRNIVWALEKLVFRIDTFSMAARLLFQFGAAENENWSNNATNQFIHLYKLLLAGTEVSFAERLQILKWGIDKKDQDFTEIAINAIAAGFQFDNFTRTSGAENQGSGLSLKDYEPTYKEIFDYWQQLISLLHNFLFLKTKLGELSRNALVSGIRFFVRYQQVHLIESLLPQVAASLETVWDDAISELNKALQYESPTQEERQRINAILVLLKPSDIKGLILTKVTKAVWDVDSEDLDDYMERPAKEAGKLAEYIVEQKIEPDIYLPLVLEGPQVQAFSFGKRLGQLTEDKSHFVLKSLDILRTLSGSSQNPEVLGGFLVGSGDDSLFNKAIEFVQSDKNLCLHAFYLVRVFKVSHSNIQLLIELSERYNLPVEHFMQFQYGRLLEHLETEQILGFCNFLQSKGAAGKWLALSMLFSVYHKNDEAFKKLDGYIRSMIMGSNFLTHGSTHHIMESFHWEQAVERLLKSSHDVDFALTISQQIIQYCAIREGRTLHESSIIKTVTTLFNFYFEDTWPIFGKSILGNYWESFRLRHLLWPIGFNNHSKSSWIFDNEKRRQFVLNWLKKQDAATYKRMASFMPIEGNGAWQSKWHPFSKTVIDEFGEAPGFLAELAANMGTYGSIGSRMSYLITQKQLLEELLGHDKLVVQDWARNMIEYTKKEIKRTELEDESI